jgi:hypothetical protein
MRRHIEQLQMDLTDAKEENEQLNQRLSTTLARVNILKTSNQVRTCILIFVLIQSFSFNLIETC